ncbi:MAG: imidazolonepropionase, partial [Candidatus Krumholzibacteria bacterium]|nr:imidazolonepropionase [Candidatus Krumholzibacteria bacterium]
MRYVVDLLLLGAVQLLTCRVGDEGPKRSARLSDVGLVVNGAVAVSKGRIFAVGTREEVEERIGAATVERTIDVGGRVVLPGWVDPHTHAVFT